MGNGPSKAERLAWERMQEESERRMEEERRQMSGQMKGVLVSVICRHLYSAHGSAACAVMGKLGSGVYKSFG